MVCILSALLPSEGLCRQPCCTVESLDRGLARPHLPGARRLPRSPLRLPQQPKRAFGRGDHHPAKHTQCNSTKPSKFQPENTRRTIQADFTPSSRPADPSSGASLPSLHRPLSKKQQTVFLSLGQEPASPAGSACHLHSLSRGPRLKLPPVGNRGRAEQRAQDLLLQCSGDPASGTSSQIHTDAPTV